VCLLISILLTLTLSCSKSGNHADINNDNCALWTIDSIADASGLIDPANGSVEAESEIVYSGLESIKLMYFGAGQNGYARLQKPIDLIEGDTITYSAAFYLPVGFKQNQTGQVSLMRWDNFDQSPLNTVQGGLVIHSDGSLVLVLQRLGAEPHYSELIPRTVIEEGQWIHLDVTQTMSTDPAVALNELRVNGVIAGKSNAINTFGQPIPQLRFGIVSVDASAQYDNLTIFIDSLRCDCYN